MNKDFSIKPEMQKQGNKQHLTSHCSRKVLSQKDPIFPRIKADRRGFKNLKHKHIHKVKTLCIKQSQMSEKEAPRIRIFFSYTSDRG